MNLKRSVASALVALCILTVPAVSQETGQPEERKNRPVEFIILGNLGYGTIKASAADRMRTSSGGIMFDLGGGLRFFNIFDIGVGGGMVWLADRDKFTNSTTGGERSSSVWPLYYYAQAGIQLPVPIGKKDGAFPVWIALHAGSVGVSVDRSVSYCIGCDVEELSMKGGTFLRPEIRLQANKGIYVGLGFALFSGSSDFKNMITLTVSGHARD